MQQFLKEVRATMRAWAVDDWRVTFAAADSHWWSSHQSMA